MPDQPVSAVSELTRLGQYQIVRRLGGSAASDVYEARDEALHRAVAIKVLSNERARNADLQWRFYTQAATAARLVHPNIAQIYYVGEDQGRCYYAMQYVAGGSLSAFLDQARRIDVDQTLNIARQILAGLAAVHRRQMVHGDLKPSNVLYDRNERHALLVDFGRTEQEAAPVFLPAQDDADASEIACRAPERLAGAALDCRSDLFALGAIVFRMLNGSWPVVAPGDKPAETISRPPEFLPDVPAKVVPFVHRLLAPAVADRYQSGEDALADLDLLQAATRDPAAVRESPVEVDSKQVPAVAAQASVYRTTIIALPSFEVLPPLPEGLLADRNQGLLDRIRELAGNWLHRFKPEIVERLQGTQFQVGAVIDEYERRREWLRKLDHEAESVLRDLASQAEAIEGKGVADGLAGRQQDSLQSLIDGQRNERAAIASRLEALDSVLTRLKSERDLLSARLRVASARIRMAGGEVSRRRPSLGTIAQLLLLAGLVGLAGVLYYEQAAGWLKQLREQRGVASSANQPGASAQSKGPILPRFSFDDLVDPDLSWIPDDRVAVPWRSLEGHLKGPSALAAVPGRGLLASVSEDGTARLWIPETGEEYRKFVYVNRHEVRELFTFACSPDGRTLALGGNLFWNTLTLWDIATGRKIRSMEGETNAIRSVTFSPDGELIAAVHTTIGNKQDGEVIWLWETSTGKPIGRVGVEVSRVRQVAFSPVNRQLAFFVRGAKEVVLWDVASGSLVRRLAGPGSIVRSIAFSPDGKYLAGGFPGGTAVIWDVETGQVTGTLTEQIGSVLSVAFSPDGTLLATTGSQVTALWNLSKSRVEWYLKARYSAVAFSNDGRWVATASQADKEGQTLFTEAEKNQLVLWNLSSMAGPTAAQGRGPRSPDAAAQVARLADELGVPLPGRQGRIPKAGFDVIPDEQQQTVPFSLGYPVSDNPLNEP